MGYQVCGYGLVGHRLWVCISCADTKMPTVLSTEKWHLSTFMVPACANRTHTTLQVSEKTHSRAPSSWLV